MYIILFSFVEQKVSIIFGINVFFGFKLKYINIGIIKNNNNIKKIIIYFYLINYLFIHLFIFFFFKLIK